MVSKVLLGYEEAFWPKKLEISHASQILTNNHKILVLSYLEGEEKKSTLDLFLSLEAIALTRVLQSIKISHLLLNFL